MLGSKSYGRNNTFLLRVGWEQVTEVFAALDDDLLGAGRAGACSLAPSRPVDSGHGQQERPDLVRGKGSAL